MPLSYRSVRAKLVDWGVFPQSTVARVTTYVVALDLLFILVSRISSRIGFRAGADLGGWVGVLSFFSVVLLLVLALRWIRRKLMWSLRNRLIVTYVFIGVIPVVLLLAMALIAAWILGGQFAILLATNDLESQLRAVETANSGMASGLAARLKRGDSATPEAIESFATSEKHFPTRQVTVWFRDKATVQPGPGEPLRLPPSQPAESRAIVLDGGKLYLRAWRKLPVGQNELAVISSVPLDKQMLDLAIEHVGEVTLSHISPADDDARGARQRQLRTSKQRQPAVSINVGGSTNAPDENRVFVRGGSLPSAKNRFDINLMFPGYVPITDWQTGQTANGGLAVSTRPSQLYARLAASFGADASAFIGALIIIAVALGIVELAALIIGLRLTRTMTRSVSELYKATQHVNRGDFRHRIAVKTQDQLAALETSFNSMTASIEKLLLEQKEKQRMENELAIAQEVQAQLFPHEISELPALEVHGICRPARTVSGDYYDFLPLGPEKLALTVGDISGKGISAALLMATLHSAVRAYSLERVPALAAATAGGDPSLLGAVPFSSQDGELSPAGVMAMLNRQLYRSTPAEKYATLFLSIYDGNSRKLTYCNAGHLPPIILGRDGSLRRLDCGGTVIGLFGGLTYQEAAIELRPGEMLLAYSDGVTEPENEFGEFGEKRLIELVQEHRDLPLARISENVISAVDDWIGGKEQPDDVTLVLARAR